MSEIKRIGMAILLVGGLMCGLSCRQKTVVKDAVARRSVVVSIPPQAWLVRRIARDCVDVNVLIRPGQDPHTYEPTLKQMARLAEAMRSSASAFRSRRGCWANWPIRSPI